MCDDEIHIGRRRMLAGSGMLLAAPAILASGSAMGREAPKAAAAIVKEPPRSFAFTLGEFEVVVFCDGLGKLSPPEKTFGTDRPAEEVHALLEQNFLPTEAAVNGYAPVLIRTPTELVLVDTGFGESGRANGSGQLVEGMALYGIKPEDVDTVILTHLHGDHILGLMAGGKPVFPKARYVTGRVEYDWWTDPARMGTPAEDGHKTVLKTVVPLKDRITFVAGGDSPVQGFTAEDAFGHTPGHTIYRVTSGERSLMLTGDTANHFVLSLQRPDWEVRFDTDKAMAAATRRKVFDAIAAEKLPFIGYHMPFPSVGFVEKTAEGYRFVPVSYQFEL